MATRPRDSASAAIHSNPERLLLKLPTSRNALLTALNGADDGQLRPPPDSHRETAGHLKTDQLYHVEIVFADPDCGPLLIGDGRWLGLGLIQPIRGETGQIANTTADTAFDETADGLDAEESEIADDAADDS